MSSRIIDTAWYTTHVGQCIGIVKTFDDITQEVKYYIGVAPGIDEESDADYIKSYGDRFFINSGIFNPNL